MSRFKTLSLTFAIALCLLCSILGRADAPFFPGTIHFDNYSVARLGIKEHPFGYAAMDELWPHPFGTVTRIPVCWETMDDKYKRYRLLVETVVRSTWAEAAALSFFGWNVCSVDARGVRIQVADEGPMVKTLGRGLDGLPSGMTLNFTLSNWRVDDWCYKDERNKDQCIKAIAVHEFGHALGLAHEQNRADTPGECQELPQGPNGNKYLTPWDKDSVMNYCNDIYRRDGFTLSHGDIGSVQAMYGSR